MEKEVSKIEDTGFFDRIREELRHWPYTIHQIDDTLDISLIEGRAKQLLFQALNGRNLTAFIGSGVSASYGRMGWWEWQEAQLRVVRELAVAFDALADNAAERLWELIKIVHPEGALLQLQDRFVTPHAADRLNLADLRNVWRWLRYKRHAVVHAQREVRKLHATFNMATSEDGKDFPGGESLPVKFEIAQKLHDLLLQRSGLFLAKPSAKDERPLLDREERDRFRMAAWCGCLPDWKEGAPEGGLGKLLNFLKLLENKGRPLTDLKDVEEKLLNQVQAVNSSFDGDYQTAFDAYLERALSPEARLPFEKLVKVLLVDECAHAEQLLLSGLEFGQERGRAAETSSEWRQKLRNKLKVIEGTNLKRAVDGIRQNPDRYMVLSAFRHSTTRRLFEAVRRQDVPERWADVIARLQPLVSDAGQAPESFLTPSNRYLVTVALSLFRDPLNDFLGDGTASDPVISKPKPTAFEGRKSVLDERLDPLAKAVRHLGVRRFLTTNYDFEIERFCQDAGYREFEYLDPMEDPRTAAKEKGRFDRGDYRLDGLGRTLRDLTFTTETASDLITFSVTNDEADISVFHLHGRATEEDKIVVTERDYMDLYLRSDADRGMVDESITMAFSAAPTLFLGLGMTEADLLRPFRQFISDRDRSVGYTSIVLLPGDENHDTRAKTATSLYLRYGVHTIFYGGGEVMVSDGPEGPAHSRAIDWLHRILALTKALAEITKARAEEVHKKSGGGNFVVHLGEAGREEQDRKARLAELDKKVNKLGPNLVQLGLGPDVSVLALLYGRRELPGLDELTSEEAPVLQHCRFTSVRPGASQSAHDARARHRTCRIDGRHYLEPALILLDALVKMALSDGHDVEQPQRHLRDLAARRAALDGLLSAFRTGALNAALDGIEKDWRLWWQDWQESPPHRLAVFENLLPPGPGTGPGLDVPDDAEARERTTMVLPRRYVRYRLANVITDLWSAITTTARPMEPATDGLPTQEQIEALATRNHTGVRTFDTFIEAVLSQRLRDTDPGQPDPGRRFYTVGAERGLGKGSFQATLMTRLGLTGYMRAAHAHRAGEQERTACGETGIRRAEACFLGAIFVNLSFSTELGSVFDMIRGALLEMTALAQALHASEQVPRLADRKELIALLHALLWGRQAETLCHWLAAGVECAASKQSDKLDKELRDLPRIRQVEELLGKFRQASESFAAVPLADGSTLQFRLLIGINAVDLLFDTDRRAKNMEIRDILALLSSEWAVPLPLDIIAVGAERELGPPWTNGLAVLQDDPSAHLRPALTHRLLVRGWEELDARGSIERRAVNSRIAFARGNDPYDNWSETSAGGVGLTRPAAERVAASRSNFVHFVRPMNPMRFLVDNFLPLAAALFLARAGEFSPREIRAELAGPAGTTEPPAEQIHKAALAYRSSKTKAWKLDVPPRLPADYRPALEAFLRVVSDVTCPAIAIVRVKGEDGWNGIPAVQPDDGLTDLRDALFERYGLDPQDALRWKTIRQTLGGNRYCLTILLAAAQQIALSERDILTGGQRAAIFIRNTVDQVRTLSVQRREEVVLEAVLNCYRGFHAVGEACDDIELHHHLLRNLAVMNAPVSANVIVRLPAIRAYFNGLGQEHPISRRRVVALALAELSERGLLFRLSAHPGLIESSEEKRHWPPEREYRYAVHRLVQRYCVSKIGGGPVDAVKVNSFAPSQYAAMPYEVPRLNHATYRFVSQLMMGLSQYPDIPHMEEDTPPWLFSTDHLSVKVEALRGALSLVRSSFSISVVSRFEDYKRQPGQEERRKRGYFETYKVRLRWLLRKSWELQERAADDDGPAGQVVEPAGQPGNGQAARPEQEGGKAEEVRRPLHALYRDEIVWLYNEVGLICLVQGNLRDAVAHLRQAIYLNRSIEGGAEGGRHHALMSLNLAVIQLERGRLQSARRRLQGIMAAKDDSRTQTQAIAEGYLGLIEHLTGNLARAETHFDDALKQLVAGRDNRACAIFMNHQARLAAREDHKLAMNLLSRAREYAETGGHQDVRHNILISEVRVSQFFAPDPYLRASEDRNKLRAVEDYAKLMGMPSLLCDSMHSQARMLMESGDTTTSGKMMSRVLALAQRNEMTLRLNEAMTTYAQILLRRGRRVSAERLLYASLEMAKRSGYNIASVRVQGLLESAQLRPGT